MVEAMKDTWFSPHSPSWRIGNLVEISATEAKIHLTHPNEKKPTWMFGTRVPIGEVNTFVFIDCGRYTIFGRLIKVWLENCARLSVESMNSKVVSNHPIGLVQLLVSVDTESGKNYQGLKQYPQLGAQVYSAHPKLVALLAERRLNSDASDILLSIAELPSDSSTPILLAPEKLFARHCAILGSTGGGKSYTMTTLLENIARKGGKALLLDATGEYKDLPCTSYYVGDHPDATDDNKVTYPHWLFTDSDIRALLRPSAQSQAPKLEEAIRSLKVYTDNYKKPNLGNLVLDLEAGVVKKEGNAKEPFEQAVLAISQNSGVQPWHFWGLANQIIEECVWPTGKKGSIPDPTIWGNRYEPDIGHCLNLIARVKSMSNNPYLRWMLDCGTKLKDIPTVIDELCVAQSGVVRLDLSNVPFESNARELLVNAIGRYLLTSARNKKISDDNPLIVCIDEAHQFLNKHIGEDTTRFDLEAFGNIAKEGRKYGLNIVIATQRPRDIPEDVLSQIGTLIVHRLTNEKDQEIVKKSVGAIDNCSASFLPVLGQGEALLLGVDFPFPMSIKVRKPEKRPLSTSARFSTSWSQKEKL